MWNKSKEQDAIKKIDNKVADLTSEKQSLENLLIDRNKELQELLTLEAMDELHNVAKLDNLRLEIEHSERRIREIESTISGLEMRKGREEEKLRESKVESLNSEIKKIDLEFYKTLRKKMDALKAIVEADAGIRKLYDEHVRLESEFKNLGEDAPLAFEYPGWLSFRVNDKETAQKRALGGPHDDLENGPVFLDGLIAQLQREVK